MSAGTLASAMNRRCFLKSTVLGAAAGCMPGSARAAEAVVPGPHSKRFEFEEWSLAELQAAMAAGKLNSATLTKKYLSRIEDLDRRGPALNSIIELNPDAVALARSLDRERKEAGPRGPLHGIPVLIKDNIATLDRMNTTAGSLALVGTVPPAEAFVVRRLREAGAVILGKTNLSEWANFRSNRSTSGWSGRGGLTKNPYALDRNPSGSSSGSAVAVAANLCAVAVGTETDGSIVSPSSVNGIVGIKPTVGLVSRSGIIPIAHSQDTAGPMARSVTDAARLLNVLAGEDPLDVRTAGVGSRRAGDYTRHLDPDGLRGARIGVVRSLFDVHPSALAIMEDALDTVRGLGATVVDPAKLPPASQLGRAEMEVLLYEFKADLNRYLAELGAGSPVHSLSDLVEWNVRNRESEMPYFDQEILIEAAGKGPLSEQPYLDALTQCRRWSREEGIDAVMKEQRLDALVAPTTGPAGSTDFVYGDRDIGGSSQPAAVAGYPSITLPAGFVGALPVGLTFFGRAFSEPTLLKFAFAFEMAEGARRAPRYLSTVG